jgi:hypothetical protein
MITIISPSMAINDPRAPRSYTMDVTKSVTARTTMEDIVTLILDAAGTRSGGVIQNLVLNAHGGPGLLAIGTGLDSSSMGPFSRVRGRVHKIWFTGCLSARIAGPATAAHGDGAALRALGVNSGDGHAFIGAFARLTGCHVVAPTEMQSGSRSSYPSGQIDSYEGLVLSYSPAGVVTWQHRYPSLFDYDTSARTAQNPNAE